MKFKILSAVCCMLGFISSAFANEKIYVNREVTTHIVMPENIKLVDISTAKIIGNQCADNIVRIKPYQENDSLSCEFKENELLGTLTLIGERHIAQYDILYTTSPNMAASIYQVAYSDTKSYINPEVSMPMSLRLGGLWQQAQVQSGRVKGTRHESHRQQHLFHRGLLLYRLLVAEQDEDSL